MFKQGEGESVDILLEETIRIKEVRKNRNSEAEFMDFLKVGTNENRSACGR
jgi:hypothetical protein